MNHDVFIGYSSKNKQVADAVVHYLEENKIRCWVASRNIPRKKMFTIISQGCDRR